MNKTDELCELFGAAKDWIGGAPFELYQRHATTLTARLGERGTVQLDRGRDAGTALRVRRPAPNGTVFAATSGSDAATVRRLIESSTADYGDVTEETPWPDAREAPEDLESSIDLPTESEATEWLREAAERLDAAGAGAKIRCARASLEIAATVESWAATPGRRMTRTRCRAFAWAHLTSDRPELPLLPLRCASRHWKLLSPSVWAERLADRAPAALEEGLPAREYDFPLLFNPETAAQLVRGFVERGIVPAAAAGAWREDPTRATALIGGTFDDGGFPAHPRKLSATERSGARFRSRPSFRDRPEPRYADLWIDAAEATLPRRAALVTFARPTDADDGRLQMLIDGVTIDDGRPQRRFRAAWVSAERAAWADGCRGGIGPPRADSAGVTTPALRFDGLRLRSRV